MFANDTSVLVQDKFLTNIINKGNVNLQNVDDWLVIIIQQTISKHLKTNYIIVETKLSKQELDQ